MTARERRAGRRRAAAYAALELLPARTAADPFAAELATWAHANRERLENRLDAEPRCPLTLNLNFEEH